MPAVDVQQTEQFAEWLGGVRDRRAKIKVLGRIARLSNGNLGDVQPVGGGVSELRVHFGPGYRVYFAQRGPLAVILLTSGTKKTQERDIRTARAVAAQLETM